MLPKICFVALSLWSALGHARAPEIPFRPQVITTEFTLNPYDQTIDLFVKEINKPAYNTRVSEVGVARDLILWQNEPFLLGRDGRLLGLDTSHFKLFKTKVKYVGIDTLLGASALFAVQGLHTFVTSLHTAQSFSNFIGQLAGTLGSVGPDITLGFIGATIAASVYPVNRLIQGARRLTNDHRVSGDNFFNQTVATNVERVERVGDDVKVYFSDQRKPQSLGSLFKSKVRRRTCKDWLVRFAG